MIHIHGSSKRKLLCATLKYGKACQLLSQMHRIYMTCIQLSNCAYFMVALIVPISNIASRVVYIVINARVQPCVL